MSWRQRIGAVVRARTGITLWAASERAVQRFVCHRTTALGLDDPHAYVAQLDDAGAGSTELARLISVVTNGQSWFMRDARQLEAAGQLMAARQAQLGRPLAVWSAGCASGEEAYSLAMVAAERGVAVQLLGSDINPEALAVARAGRYGGWSLRRVEPLRRERFFQRDATTYRVAPALRRAARFEASNLVHGEWPGAPDGRGWDLIVCRNVLIYFDRELAACTLRRLAGALEPGGELLLGAGEQGEGAGLQPVVHGARLSYRKPPLETVCQSSAPVPGGDAGDLPARVRITEARLAQLSAAGGAPEGPDSGKADQGAATYRCALGRANAGALAEAAGLLEAHLSSYPADVRGWLARGLLCLRMHDFEAALEALGAAQSCESLRAEVYYFQGLALRKMGELERAASALDRARFINPDLWQASYLLANVAHRLGRAEQSRREFRRSLAALTAERPPISCGPMDAMSSEQVFAGWVAPTPDEAACICRMHLAMPTSNPPESLPWPPAPSRRQPPQRGAKP